MDSSQVHYWATFQDKQPHWHTHLVSLVSTIKQIPNLHGLDGERKPERARKNLYTHGKTVWDHQGSKRWSSRCKARPLNTILAYVLFWDFFFFKCITLNPILTLVPVLMDELLYSQTTVQSHFMPGLNSGQWHFSTERLDTDHLVLPDFQPIFIYLPRTIIYTTTAQWLEAGPRGRRKPPVKKKKKRENCVTVITYCLLFMTEEGHWPPM